MKTAHQDPLVTQVAGAIAAASDLQRLLLYARTAILLNPPLPKNLNRIRGQMVGPDVKRANIVDKAVQAWRESLSKAEFGDRRGAVIERLVAILVGERVTPAHVYEEQRVVFYDGGTTTPFDILASPPASVWEGMECKAGAGLDDDQGANLSWAAEQAANLGEQLVVVVVSAADRATLGPILRGRIKRGDLVRLVTVETFASLRHSTSTLTVMAA